MKPMRNLILLILLLPGILSACAESANPTPAASVAADGALLVAWAQDGDLWRWHSGTEPEKLVTGDVLRPLMSPDGSGLAFWRGDTQAPPGLWRIDADGETVEIAAAVGDAAWLNNETLLFNTLTPPEPAPRHRDDLYRAGPDGETELLLEAGAGGRFFIGPDSVIALVRAGQYEGEAGSISIYRIGEAPQELLTFPAVASGAHEGFYPVPRWLPDGSGLYVAIPPADLLYQETEPNPPTTALWYLPLTGEAQPLGEMVASFFGQPRWSADAAHMVYLRRTPASNALTLFVAGADGGEAVEYTMDAGGYLSLPAWQGDGRFVYSAGDNSVLQIGAPGQAAQALPEALALQLVGDYLIYAAEDGAGISLYVRAGDATERIAQVGPHLPLFDARMVQEP